MILCAQPPVFIHSRLPSPRPARHRPGHQAGPFHDGDAAGNGLQRPAAQPAAAEEARLQPAAHRQRAGADGRGQPERGGRRAALSVIFKANLSLPVSAFILNYFKE